MKRFPRVLFVTKSQINDIDSAGAALRGWFKEWPSDQLAQIFSGVAGASAPFCRHQFQLGAGERRFGSTFFSLKGSALGESAQPYKAAAGRSGSGGVRGTARAAARRAGKTLIDTGLWEVVFPPRFSARLTRWIEAFRPEVLFVQGCDLSFMRLPLLIQQRYGVPICFDVVDDWVAHLYRGTAVSPLMRGVVERTFRELVEASAVRFTIGDLMASEYATRYCAPFEPLMQCDDQGRFTAAARPRQSDDAENPLEIVYSGSLALGRWKALVTLGEACERLRARGLAVGVTAYVPFVPEEARAAVDAAHTVTIRSAPRDREVPGILGAADVLFLPESFDAEFREAVRLSVSTKAHLYMMSRRPILVYGPANIGTVEYARREAWGHVVDEEGVLCLAAAVERLVFDRALRARLLERAKHVAQANHSGDVVRERLREALAAAAERVAPV